MSRGTHWSEVQHPPLPASSYAEHRAASTPLQAANPPLLKTLRGMPLSRLIYAGTLEPSLQKIFYSEIYWIFTVALVLRTENS